MDLIDIDTVYGEQYTTMLPVRYNVGGSFIINQRSSVNLLLNGVSFGHHLYPALSVSYSYNIKSILGLLGSYNIFKQPVLELRGRNYGSAGPASAVCRFRQHTGADRLEGEPTTPPYNSG